MRVQRKQRWLRVTGMAMLAASAISLASACNDSGGEDGGGDNGGNQQQEDGGDEGEDEGGDDG